MNECRRENKQGEEEVCFFRVFYFGNQLNITASSSNSRSKQLNTPPIQLYTSLNWAELFVYADKTYSGLFSVSLKICLQWPIDFTQLKLEKLNSQWQMPALQWLKKVKATPPWLLCIHFPSYSSTDKNHKFLGYMIRMTEKKCLKI